MTAAAVAVAAPSRHRSGIFWISVTIVLVAANLRPAVVGVSPLLDDIRATEQLSGTTAGVLTALPVLCFGLLAPLAPWMSRRVGIERALLVALVTLFAGIALRVAPSTVALFGGTVLVGGAIAVGNVLLPSLIKRDFADRAGLMTGLYTMAISGGGALGAGMTVPMAHAAGAGWHIGLGLWALFAGLALLAWLPQLHGGARRAAGAAGGVAAPRLWRDGLAWQVTGFMGLQSLSFYAAAAWLPTLFVDRGFEPATAGLLLSVASFVGIASSLVSPVLAVRMRRQAGIVVVATAFSAAGLLGVLLVPGAEWVSMAVLGVGQGAAISLALTLIVLRAPDGPHAAQLSGMAQTVGYTIAAFGPFAVGAMHDLTGGWTAPLLLLLVLFVPQGVLGAAAGRDRLVRRSSRGPTRPTPASGPAR